MKLDFRDFVLFLNQGREIEIVFENKKYFFTTKKKNNGILYLFGESDTLQCNELLVFKNAQELLDLQIQNYSLIEVLLNLQDYINRKLQL